MKKFLLAFCFMVGVASQALAQTMIYRPNNPNFGPGNIYTYSTILSSAQAQDRNKDPSAESTSTNRGLNTGQNSLNNFAQNLQNQLLNRITNSLLGDQFGEGTLRPGTYTFGSFQVEISNGTEGVILRIVDGQGGETTITIPYF
jgi:curli production assembly/transport component CsgF